MRYLALILALAAVVAVAAVAPAASRGRGERGEGESAHPRKGDEGPDKEGRRDGSRRERGDRDGRHRLRPGPFGPLTDEEIEKVLAFLAEHLPDLHERVRSLKEENPVLFQAYLRRLRFEIHQLEWLRQHDRKAFREALEEKRLHLEARDLAARYRGTEDEAERERIAEELEGVLGRLFEAEMVAREAKIRRIEEGLKRLRKDLKEQAANKDRLVQERLERLLSGERDEPRRPHRREPPPPGHEGPPPPPPDPADEGPI